MAIIDSGAIDSGVGTVLIVLNIVISILILQYNKTAFLFATILTFNPLIWIINGIYLSNRWSHPKVNKQSSKHND